MMQILCMSLGCEQLHKWNMFHQFKALLVCRLFQRKGSLWCFWGWEIPNSSRSESSALGNPCVSSRFWNQEAYWPCTMAFAAMHKREKQDVFTISMAWESDHRIVTSAWRVTRLTRRIKKIFWKFSQSSENMSSKTTPTDLIGQTKNRRHSM